MASVRTGRSSRPYATPVTASRPQPDAIIDSDAYSETVDRRSAIGSGPGKAPIPGAA